MRTSEAELRAWRAGRHGITGYRRTPLCALTIDVEDWYQSYMGGRAPLSDRLVRNVDLILEVLAAQATRATFFVLGEVARKFPQLMQRIAGQGHEIQSHGDRHVPLTEYTPAGLAAALDRARRSTEDAAGMRVWAFRAPYFSIGPANFRALDAIAEAGFTADSSVFPARTPWYGVSSWPLGPHYLTAAGGQQILEVPVAVAEWKRFRLPVAGGGYFRLLPQEILNRSLHGIIAGGRPAVLYCHPYEFCPDEVDDYRGVVPWTTRLRAGMGRRFAIERLQRLLREMPFGTFGEAVADWRRPNEIAREATSSATAVAS